jgi:hypothetical protein
VDRRWRAGRWRVPRGLALPPAPGHLMELDPLYCDVIVTRFEQFTGQKAQRQAA